jgi:hypothetical protein
VDGPGDELFPGACLTKDTHVRIGFRGLRNSAQHVLHPFRFPNQVWKVWNKVMRLRPGCFLGEYETAAEECAADDSREGVAIRRQDHEVERTGSMKPFGKPVVSLLCHDDPRRLIFVVSQQ